MGSPKVKPNMVEDAVSLALEKQSFLNNHGHQPATSPIAAVNNLVGPSTSQKDIITGLIFAIEEVKRVIDERSDPSQRGRSGERSTCPTIGRYQTDPRLESKPTQLKQ